MEFENILDVISPKEIDEMVEKYCTEIIQFLDKKKEELIKQKKAGTFVSKVRTGDFPVG